VNAVNAPHLTPARNVPYSIDPWLLVGSHAASPPSGTVIPHLYALLTVSQVLGLSSRFKCSQDICSQSTVHTSDTLCRFFTRYNLLTYLLTYHGRRCMGGQGTCPPIL